MSRRFRIGQRVQAKGNSTWVGTVEQIDTGLAMVLVQWDGRGKGWQGYSSLEGGPDSDPLPDVLK